ncbi:GNAT family N-acetyltransferase [Muricauda sp. JGD-17]|uniref:GNAT family N-acetyltransferase n=1 Tax=Flagellimonas ochracea TaxID=2696472 RepID=A0A964WVZ2_9FLAO|nr:GNAT family N-acetyltransferase [Allomuricauda ochracea]
MITKTERLLIAKADFGDKAFILELLNSPTWLEFIGDKGVATEKQAQHYIKESLIGSYAKNGFGLYKISVKESLESIGLCGFLQRDYLENPDLGFALLPKYEGNGFMREAAKAIMQFGKSQLKLDCISAIVMPKNVRSKGLLEKIGFKQVGIVHPPGSDEGLLLFSNQKSHPN